MTNWYRVFACVVFACLASLPAMAKVFVSSKPNFPPEITISGEITKEDVAQVKAAITRYVVPQGPWELWIFLDSNGGDIDSAMAIGRLIKKKAARGVVNNPDWIEIREKGEVVGWRHPPAVCASACVFILAAGSDKLASEKTVGIHRPYSIGATRASSYADTRARYAASAARVKAYLDEMGMPARLHEEMMRVPAEKVRWLTMEEQDELGLFGTSPAWEDAQDSQAAARRGISKQEWLRRKARADQECPPQRGHIGDFDVERKWADCRQRVYGPVTKYAVSDDRFVVASRRTLE